MTVPTVPDITVQAVPDITASESLLVALFCMSMVFFALFCLYALIRLFSLLLQTASAGKAPVPEQPPRAFAAKRDVSSGTLKLRGVDEPTAAMIMAIVSHESGIPLSMLCFKSIQLTRG